MENFIQTVHTIFRSPILLTLIMI